MSISVCTPGKLLSPSSTARDAGNCTFSSCVWRPNPDYTRSDIENERKYHKTEQKAGKLERTGVAVIESVVTAVAAFILYSLAVAPADE